ncbi:MAG: hypothetical protein ACREU9_12910, partial [Gammaproteobacteria bacterium]
GAAERHHVQQLQEVINGGRRYGAISFSLHDVVDSRDGVACDVPLGTAFRDGVEECRPRRLPTAFARVLRRARRSCR